VCQYPGHWMDGKASDYKYVERILIFSE
jgi:hypothetical protein